MKPENARSRPDLFPRYQAKSKKILAVEFGVHPDTIANWCKMIGMETKKGLLSVKEVKKFYSHFGDPFE
ncbi:hypothetical protein FUAX_09930 [Fulvitalea axinellae]|uniref:Uncharacterized protein n=1 Tax=Fulvitalea axinellae TaxID=1182444 RepID=A0AAU9D6T9_9BACT|nr:hypothetical protein FUAX_09930 [Fulvitalea axinellae]